MLGHYVEALQARFVIHKGLLRTDGFRVDGVGVRRDLYAGDR